MSLVSFGYRASKQALDAESPDELPFQRIARLPIYVELDLPIPQFQLTTKFSRLLKDIMQLTKEIVDREVTSASVDRRDPRKARQGRVVIFEQDITFRCSIQFLV